MKIIHTPFWTFITIHPMLWESGLLYHRQVFEALEDGEHPGKKSFPSLFFRFCNRAFLNKR